eukprot:1179754-Pleurochrysis_carterae.AAC.2
MTHATLKWAVLLKVFCLAGCCTLYAYTPQGSGRVSAECYAKSRAEALGLLEGMLPDAGPKARLEDTASNRDGTFSHIRIIGLRDSSTDGSEGCHTSTSISKCTKIRCAAQPLDALRDVHRDLPIDRQRAICAPG